MPTIATKPVTRTTAATVRDGGERRMVVTVYPDGQIGLKPEGLRKTSEVRLDAAALYYAAVKKADAPRSRALPKVATKKKREKAR